MSGLQPAAVSSAKAAMLGKEKCPAYSFLEPPEVQGVVAC